MLKQLRIVRATLAACALLTAVSVRAAQTVFYEAANCTEEGWTCQNATNGGWTIGTDNFIKGTTNSGTNNSWLFSPELKLKAGVRYTFSYSVKAYSSSYPIVICNFYLVTERTKTSYRSAVCDLGNVTTSNATAVVPEVDFTPENDMTVYFAANDKTVYGSKKGYILQFRNFKIMADDGKTVPLPVTDLTAVPETEGSTRVTLSWTNPQEMSDGSDAEIASVTVFRNDETVATLTDAEYVAKGAAVSYTDEVTAPGKYTYAVEVTASNGEKSARTEVTTGYIGVFPAIVPDYTFDFSDETTNEHWALTAGDDSNEWTINPSAGALQVSVSNQKVIDACATTPAIALDAAKAYRLTYSQKATNPANIINMECLAGADKEALSAVLAPLAQVDSKTAVEKNFRFSPAQTGNIYFRWHATAERMTSSYYSNTASISDISIVEIPVLPRIATDVRATAATDGALSATVTWVNPTLSETGLPLDGLTADIMRDGALIAEGVEASGTYTDASVPCAGYHTYQVIIRNAAGATDETPESAESDYIGMPFAVPFASDFAGNPFAWKTMAVGEADPSVRWTIGSSAAVLKANDKTMSHALLTPPLTMASDEVYELTVNGKNSGYSEYTTSIYLLAPGSAPEETNLIAKSSLGYTAKDMSVRFAASEPGTYQLAYLIEPIVSSYGNGYERTFTINSLSVTTAPKCPAVPEDIRALSTDDNKVEITWTMPAETPEGVALTEDVTVKIFRGAAVADDSEPVFEVSDRPGTALSYLDDAPAEGLNTYSLLFIYADQQTVPVAVESDFVGEAVKLMYNADFTTDEGRARWTVVDNSSSYYKGTTFEYTADNTLRVVDGDSESSRNSRLDDWIISPAFTVYTGSTIIVKFDAKGYVSSSSDSYKTPYEIYLGKDRNVDNLKAGIRIAAGTLDSSEFTTYSHEYVQEGSRAAGQEKKVVGLRFGGSYAHPYAEVSAVSLDSDRRTATGLDRVGDDADAASLRYDGTTVSSLDADAVLTVFDTTGRMAAIGEGSVNIGSLASGIYIVTACLPAEGKTVTMKIAK